MKKIIKLSIIALLAIVACTSCSLIESDKNSGKVNYSGGFESAQAHGFDNMRKIENAYVEQLRKIDGADFARDLFFDMEGKYSKCDEIVVAACKEAEKNLTDLRLEDDEYYVFEITATYYSNTNTKQIYRKEFR